MVFTYVLLISSKFCFSSFQCRKIPILKSIFFFFFFFSLGKHYSEGFISRWAPSGKTINNPKSLLTLWKVYSLEIYSDNRNESGINQMKPKENRTDIACLPPFRKYNVINSYSCSPLFPQHLQTQTHLSIDIALQFFFLFFLLF